MLVLDAGDLLFKKNIIPVPENNSRSVTAKAEVIIESFNRMGYDAMGIGDDDLTFGKEFLLEISKKANFPLLSSNVFDESSGKPLWRPYLLKEAAGLRIGIFSLLGPETFLGETDSRRKGLTLRSPVEVAQNMVKELQPKTDLIILLSHLSYPRDLELAQAVSGIHIIVGAHTAMNLVNPPVVKNTIVLQTAPKGMYIGRLDLIFSNHGAPFYNLVIKRSLENNIKNYDARLNSKEVPENGKVEARKMKEDAERKLQQLQGMNEFQNKILALTEALKEDPEIASLVQTYTSKFPGPGPGPGASPSPQ